MSDTTRKLNGKGRDRRQLLRAAAGLAALPLLLSFATGSFAQANLDALIKAAKTEGEVVLYSSSPDNQTRRVVDAFTKKYGIKISFIRLGSNQLQQRYAAEAESGNIAADLLFNAGTAVAFAEEGMKKGWVESISKAGIPVIESGEFPAKYNNGPTAVVQVTPWLIIYNTDKVKRGEEPKNWPDVLNPKYKGQIIIPDPKASDAYLDVWVVILDAHGPQFFSRLMAQNPRLIASSAVAAQSLGAGEGMIMFPSTVARALDVKSKGGPVDVIAPDRTSGVEIQAMLTARAKAKHPAAARLLTNYVLSREGNKVYNDEPGGITMYDSTGLPKDYQTPKEETIKRKDEIFRLLGLK